MSVEKIREAEGYSPELTVCDGDNFVEDPFLDGKLMLLSKKRSDMIFLSFFIHILIW